MQANIEKLTPKALNCLQKSISSPQLSQLPSLGHRLRINPRYPITLQTDNYVYQGDCREPYSHIKTLEFYYQQSGDNDRHALIVADGLSPICNFSKRNTVSNVSQNNLRKTILDPALVSRLRNMPTLFPAPCELEVLKSPTQLEASSGLQFDENCHIHGPCTRLSDKTTSSPNCYSKYRSYSNSDDTTRIYWQMNEIFSERLQIIDDNAQDHEWKLEVLEEWLDILLKVNYSVINNIEKLESSLAENLERVQRKDIDSLKVLYNNKRWKSRGLSLESISPVSSLDISDLSKPSLLIDGELTMKKLPAGDELEQKLCDYIKSLAIVVTEKQDRVKELEKQIAAKQREMQEKFRDKDEIIEKLQNELSKSFLFKIVGFVSRKFQETL
uniref:Uncharacterized protein n=1 Tax=Glossina palpalis gambiensis TaxID=67801 RepID=A0A1B0B5Z1_9MUSC